jgi:hypothetical protein
MARQHSMKVTLTDQELARLDEMRRGRSSTAAS